MGIEFGVGSIGSASPRILGGSGATQTLTLQTTTGVGTTGADIVFKVGNNGATEAMRILNSGRVGIGTNAPAALLNVVDFTVVPVTFRRAQAGDGDRKAALLLDRSTNSGAGTPTVNDAVSLYFQVRDAAVANVTVAEIAGRIVDLTSSSNNQKGALDFYTKTAGSALVTVKVSILDDGRLVATAPNSVIADGSLANSQYSFYLDEAANALKVKVKYSNGTVKIGSITVA